MLENFWRPTLARFAPLLGALPVATALVALAAPRDAWAYLDPGTGSFALQMAIASSLAALFTVKTWWRQAKMWMFQGARATAPAAVTATPIATRRGRLDERD